jgi:hypothetical protein
MACCQNYGTLAVPFIAPVIVFILSGIVGYALKRYNLARILYVDVDYRLRFEILAVYHLKEQIKKLRKWSEHHSTTRPPPLIRMVKEEHFVLSSIQGDLKSCLWGNEIDAVRNFYRDFQLVEHRAGKVEELYSDLVKKYVECPTSKPSDLSNYPTCYVEQIDKQYKIIKEIVEFWFRTLGNDHNFTFGATPDPHFRSELAFPEAAQNLLYRRLIWYPTFVVIPFLAIAGIFGVLFFAVFLGTWKDVVGCIAENRWLSLVIALATIVVFVVLPFCLKDCGDRTVERNVLRDFEARLLLKLHAVWASPAEQSL